MPLVPERFPFTDESVGFDPTPFLPCFEAAVFLEPRLLQLPGVPTGKPQVPPPWQPEPKEVLLQLLRRWDESKRLRVFLAEDCPPGTRMRVQSVAKSAEVDRMICNRQRMNSFEHSLEGASFLLPDVHGLGDLILPPGHHLVLYVSDLSDMYHHFKVSTARARTNCMARTFSWDDLSFAAEVRRRPEWKGKRLVAAFGCLPMGDGAAVDIACRSHLTLLARAGAISTERLVQGQSPLPRGPDLDMVYVDDLCKASVVPAGSPPAESPSASSFRVALEAYRREGLPFKAEKVIRGAKVANVLGANVNGIEGLLSARQDRLLQLVEATFALLATQKVAGAHVRRLVSSWLFVLSFARPALSVFAVVFRWLGNAEQDHLERQLPHTVRTELMLAVTLVPLLFTSLRAEVHPVLFTTDASPTGLGGAHADVGSNVAQEMWRVRERRGHHTRLSSSMELSLRAADPDFTLDPELLPEVREGRQSVPRLLLETWDFIEVFSGGEAPLSSHMASRGLRVGPCLDLKQHGTWDIQENRVWCWLAWLVEQGRVRYLHGGPPCTTFSIARHPKERSRANPLGRPCSRAVRHGNILFLRFLALFWVAAKRGSCTVTLEHPASSFAWRLPQVQTLLQKGASFLSFDVCAFGPLYPFRQGREMVPAWVKKSTTLLALRAGFLDEMQQRCPRNHSHVQLAGALTSRAAQYGEGVCEEWARLTAASLKSPTAEDWVEVDAALPEDKAPALLEGWFVDFLGGATFAETFQTRVPPTEHINVRELEAVHGLVKRLVLQGVSNAKILLGVDSLVARGVINKGRSASTRLNKVWRKVAPYLLASQLSLGVYYVPSALNPADAPSRHRAVPPCKWALPKWAVKDEISLLDKDRLFPKFRLRSFLWWRLVKNLLDFAKKDFDSTLGFPGEGPRPPRHDSAPVRGRPPLDLSASAAHTPQVQRRRALYWSKFAIWHQDNYNTPGTALFLLTPRAAGLRLGRYGQYLYDRGRSLLEYSEVLNACVDMLPSWRRQLQEAWVVAWSWKAATDANNRLPCPAVVVRALAAVLLLLQRPLPALGLLLGFAAFLRPVELSALTLEDVVLPEDLGVDVRALFCRIRNPKNRRLAARLEHVRVDQPGLLAFARAIKQRWPRDARLFLSYAALSREWSRLCCFLGLPASGANGLTPASLRSGGASWLFHSTQDLSMVRWRGRWAAARTLDIYVQEVAALSVLPALPPPAQARIQFFAARLPSLSAAFCAACARAP